MKVTVTLNEKEVGDLLGKAFIQTNPVYKKVLNVRLKARNQINDGPGSANTYPVFASAELDVEI
jgi:hypothetical protein